MEKITATSDGINWQFYYEFQLSAGILHQERSWRAHKYENRGEHINGCPYVNFHDAHGISGYGRRNTHATLKWNDGTTKKYRMFDRIDMAKIAEQADDSYTKRLFDSLRYNKSVVNTVKKNIKQKMKLPGPFGADAPGSIY